MRLMTVFLMFYVQSVFAADIVYTCAGDGIGDQDDMCIWLHPDDPSKSFIITADKDAWKLFVYSLAGEELASYDLPHRPGNIDVVYDFPLNGDLVDIVGFNTRSVNNARFGFYKIDQDQQGLDSLGYPLTENWSDELYGFALYHSQSQNAFYAFGSDQSSRIQQYRFFDDGTGQIVLEHKRTFQNGSASFPTEGMVVDQEHGLLYAGNENEGIYVYGAEEGQSTDHLRFIGLDPGKLDDDVEGLTIYYAAGGQGYLLASSQGENYFSVFDRSGDNQFIGTFTINDVEDTDGIDVLSLPLNQDFPAGIFACHNDRLEPQHVELVSWADIADDLDPDLPLDTSYWNPRLTSTHVLDHSGVYNLNLYPNPTQDIVNIGFDLERSAHVRCFIYNMEGKLEATLMDDLYQAGTQMISWNAKVINGAGLIYIKLEIGNHTLVQKIMLI